MSTADVMGEMEYKDCPKQIQRIADVIGLSGALKLWGEFKGRVLYVPSFKLANATIRAAQIRVDYAAGMSVRDIAEKYNITDVWAYVLVKGGAKDAYHEVKGKEVEAREEVKRSGLR